MAGRRLSRGLEHLLSRSSGGQRLLEEIPVESIRENPRQPRKNFGQEELEALARSIEQEGLLQPLVVRRVSDGYQLIAGERRLRAVRSLGWRSVPALVREENEGDDLVLALAENLLRESLDPIEEAAALRTLHEDLGLTHEEIGRRLGRSRASVSNAIRLLELPDWIQDLVSRGTLSPGHARALVGLPDDAVLERLVRRILDDQWTVRQTEEHVRSVGASRERSGAGAAKRRSSRGSVPSVEARDLERRLTDAWGVLARVVPRARGGSIRFDCKSREEFEALLRRLLDAAAARSQGAGTPTTGETDTEFTV